MKLIEWKGFKILGILIVIIGSIFSALSVSYIDEDDNILGGLLMNRGEIPYLDFFSHHMPAPYFIASSITFFTGNNVIYFKIIWGIILGIWLVILGWQISRLYSFKAGLTFIFLSLISAPSLMSSGLLAETLVGYSAITLFILVLHIHKADILKLKYILIFSIFNSLIVLSSLGFIYVSFFYYLILVFLILKKRTNLKNLLGIVVLIALPYLLLSLYLLFNNILGEFIFGNYTFNTKYYSLYQGELEGNLVSSTIRAFIRTFDSTTRIIINILEGKDIILFLFLSSILLSLALFFKIRKYFEAFLIAMLFILLNIREGGVNEYFGSNFHGMTYYMFSIFTFSLCVHLIYKYIKHSTDFFTKLILLLFLCYAIFVPTYIIRSSLRVINNKLNNTYFSNINNTSEYINFINIFVNDGEYVWVGPFDTFRDIIKLNPILASKYTFYLPWQDSCIECNSEIIKDFEDKKPLLIYWKEDVPILKGWANGIDFKIYKYIQENYFTIEDERYTGFYFRNEFKDTILQRINKL